MSRLALPVSEQRDHIRGSLRDAEVVLVEYGDYECPYCGAAQPVVDSLQAMFGDRLCTVFRHFPLTQIHPHALHAAEAAECAGAQDAFWPMHEVLYENQQALDDPSLIEYADELGLDVQRFASELASGMHEERVRDDFMSGIRSGVNGTPTFFINGQRYEGAYDLQSLGEAIQQASMVRSPAR